MEQTTAKTLHMLLFRDTGPDMYRRLSAEERQSLLGEWNAWYDGLAAEGKMVTGHPLEGGGRMVNGGIVRSVDGPFAETKELIGGYFLLNVATLDEATEIAKQCPSMYLGITVEVRTVANLCPVLRAQKLENQEVETASLRS